MRKQIVMLFVDLKRNMVQTEGFKWIFFSPQNF